MKKIILITIFIILIILIYIKWVYYSPEQFTTGEDQFVLKSPEPKTDAGKFNSISGGLQISMEDIKKMNNNTRTKFLDTSLFSNVITYHNDEVFSYSEMTPEKLGINKCLNNKNCKYCVEFGDTGTAFCYQD